MHRQTIQYLQRILIAADIVLPNIFLFFAFWIYAGTTAMFFDPVYLYYVLKCNIIWFALMFISGSYAKSLVIHPKFFTKRTAQVFLFWLLILMLYLFADRGNLFSRIFIFSSVTTFAAALLTNRIIYSGIKHFFVPMIIWLRK